MQHKKLGLQRTGDACLPFRYLITKVVRGEGAATPQLIPAWLSKQKEKDGWLELLQSSNSKSVVIKKRMRVMLSGEGRDTVQK